MVAYNWVLSVTSLNPLWKCTQHSTLGIVRFSCFWAQLMTYKIYSFSMYCTCLVCMPSKYAERFTSIITSFFCSLSSIPKCTEVNGNAHMLKVMCVLECLAESRPKPWPYMYAQDLYFIHVLAQTLDHLASGTLWCRVGRIPSAAGIKCTDSVYAMLKTILIY